MTYIFRNTIPQKIAIAAIIQPAFVRKVFV